MTSSLLGNVVLERAAYIEVFMSPTGGLCRVSSCRVITPKVRPGTNESTAHFAAGRRIRRAMRTSRTPLALLLVVGFVGSGCGASKGPTEPGSGSSGSLSAPSGLGIANVSVRNRTTTFTWNAVPGATGYVLEVGSTTNGTEFAVITLEGGPTTHLATDLPVGISYARVRAKNASTVSAAGTELRFIVPDIRDIIEALFFETGPNRYTDTNGNSSGGSSVWLAWAPGSNIRARVAGLNDQEYEHVERSLQQVEEATNGLVRGSIVERLDEPFAPNNMHAGGELRVVVHSDMQAYCGNATVAGCGGLAIGPQGYVTASAVRVRPGQTADVFMHELGHSVLGLKHIQLGPWRNLAETTWPGLPRPTMFPTASVGPAVLTPTELDAIRMVYAAGLRAAARRSDFYAAGLINNP
jgi:hypothetical protein